MSIVYKDKIICSNISSNNEILGDTDYIYTFDDVALFDKLRANYKQSLYNIKQNQLKFKIESLNSDFTIGNIEK